MRRLKVICDKCKFKFKSSCIKDCPYRLELIVSNELANKEQKYINFSGRIEYSDSKAVVRNATFELKDNIIIWLDGTWLGGTWLGGTWLGGVKIVNTVNEEKR